MKKASKAHLFFFIALGTLFLLLVFYARTYNYTTANISWIYWAYSIIATSYFTSRVLAAIFYRTPGQKVFTTPTVAFVIPAYNEEQVIGKTIRHCFEVNYPREKIEVVVVNDCSTDNTWSEIMEAKKIYPRLNAVNLPVNGGKREAMARGIRLCNSEIYIQLDSDSYLEKDSLRPLLSVLEDKKMAGVTAHVDPENKDDNMLTKMQTAFYFLAFRFHKAGESTLGLNFCLSGCCSAYRRNYVLPLLDEWTSEKPLGVKATFGDDRSLTNLLIKEGFNTAYCDMAQSYTIIPNTMRAFFKQQLRWKKGWIIGTTTKTSRYILKRDALVGIIYIYPQILMNFLAPLIVLHAFYIIFFSESNFLLLYFLAVLGIYFFYIIYFSIFRQDEYRPYIFLWGLTNLFLSTVTFLMAILTLKDNGWGTR